MVSESIYAQPSSRRKVKHTLNLPFIRGPFQVTVTASSIFPYRMNTFSRRRLLQFYCREGTHTVPPIFWISVIDFSAHYKAGGCCGYCGIFSKLLSHEARLSTYMCPLGEIWGSESSDPAGTTNKEPPICNVGRAEPQCGQKLFE